ncbi:MAG: hypothetical protein QM775_34070 [Pirellulales bacterium]
MNDQPDQDREETWPAALLRGLQDDAPPPDPQRLAALRETSLQAFAREGVAETSSPPVVAPASLSTPNSPNRSPMMTLALRGWVFVATTAALIAVWFNVSDPQPVRGAPFSEVLARLQDAKTLQLRITRDGRTSDVWVRAPGLVRWDDAPGRYRVAAGSRLWQIDETTNTSVPGDSPWFAGADQPIDLLKLLTTDVADGAPLGDIVLAGQGRYADRDCLVYRGPLATKQGPLAVEAFVDRRGGQLCGIVARREGVDQAGGPPWAELQLVAPECTGRRSEVRAGEVAHGRRPHRQDRGCARHHRFASAALATVDPRLS